jgi:hypothetical protein
MSHFYMNKDILVIISNHTLNSYSEYKSHSITMLPIDIYEITEEL